MGTLKKRGRKGGKGKGKIEPLVLKDVGTRIRSWRVAVPMKSFELAAILKISQGSLSDIENNKSLPSATTIAAFYEWTDMDIIWMLLGIVGASPGRISGERSQKKVLTIDCGEGGNFVLYRKE